MSADDRYNEEMRLGEMPSDLLREHGVSFEGRGQLPPPGSVPGDIAYQSRGIQGGEGVTGYNVPENKAFVDSVYDARPINAYDVEFTGVIQPGSLPGETNATSIDVENVSATPGVSVQYKYNMTYLVPGDKVLVIRGMKWILNPFSWPRGPFAGPRLTVLINDVVQQGYDNIFINSAQRNEIPTYIIAGPGDTVKISVTGTSHDLFTAYPVNQTDAIYIAFRANFLLSRGVPKEFEIGSAK